MPAIRKYGSWYFLAALVLVAGFIWGAVFRVEAHWGNLFLHALDVGQGDAIFIEAPNGNQVLIDGGPDDTVLARLGGIMPFWDRSIDLVVLTHPHADHLDGLLAVLERYNVGAVLESGVNHTIPEYGIWRKEVQRRSIPRTIARRNAVIHLGSEVEIRLWAPFQNYEGVTAKNIHDAAVVMELMFSDSRALLMADAESPLERKILAAGGDIRADVLKIGHHGSKTSTSAAFLAAVRPHVALISAGRKNRYGHPAGEVLDRLAAVGVRILRTDEGGTVTLVSDGSGFVHRP